MRKLLLLFALAIAPGCAPLVTHGPRVEPGTDFALSAGGARNLACDDCGGDFLLPAYSATVRYSVAAEGGRPAMSAALVAVSPRLESSGVDLYVQVPGGGDRWAGGAGMLASPAHVMPYLQFGRVDPGGSGWFTTQGYAWMAEFEPGFQLDPPYTRVEPRYWTPALAYRRRVGRDHLQLSVSGAFGSYRHRTLADGNEPEVVERRTASALMFGVSLDTDFRNLFR